MKRLFFTIIMIILLSFSAYAQNSAIQTTKTKEPSAQVLIYDSTSNGWKEFTNKQFIFTCAVDHGNGKLCIMEDGKPTGQRIESLTYWKPMWSGIELTKDGFAITDDKDYTYIEVPNTEISSYYDKRTKELKINISGVTYIYKWNEDLKDFDFINVLE